LKINKLELGDSLKVSDIQLPPGASFVTNPDDFVCQIVEIIIKEETVEETEAPAEPEIIGRKPAEEEEENE